MSAPINGSAHLSSPADVHFEEVPPSQSVPPRQATPPGPYSYTKEKRAYHKINECEDTSRHGQVRPQLDPFFGQTGALPENDATDQDEEGLRYLRAVRAEAMGLGGVLTTSHGQQNGQTQTNDDQPNDEFWTEDEAYIALGPVQHDEHDFYDDTPRIHDLYSKILCLRFSRLRAQLGQNPPAALVQSMYHERHPTTIPPATKRKSGLKFWKPFLQETDPLPVQVCSMDSRTVLKLLGYVESIIRNTREHENISPHLSRWIWALLGRVEDVGQLTNEEVGAIRSLAKTAVHLVTRYRLRGIREAQEQDDDYDYDSDDCEEPNRDIQGPADAQHLESNAAEQYGTDSEVAVAGICNKQGVGEPIDQDSNIAANQISPGPTQHEPEMVPSLSTLAILETIVIVTGEFFGQKDLLQARTQFWGEDT